jgi:hypothetical protein
MPHPLETGGSPSQGEGTNRRRRTTRVPKGSQRRRGMVAEPVWADVVATEDALEPKILGMAEHPGPWAGRLVGPRAPA